MNSTTAFWINKINLTTNPRLLWQSIDKISGKSSSKVKDKSSLNATEMSAFFARKIQLIQSSTENASPPTFTIPPADFSFSSFTLLTEDQVTKLVMAAPKKLCDLDPLPTNMLKECILYLFYSLLTLPSCLIFPYTLPPCHKYSKSLTSHP